jgi:serine/threonine protein phosphatase 1
MNRIFAIGDLHGCSLTFRKLILEKIDLQKEDDLYLLGDYVDRGPDSKGVIDFILELKEKGFKVHTLRGNHDQMMMDSGKNKGHFRDWVENGGKETLKSFGVKSYDEMESKYKTFFYETKFYFETGLYILVHAGLNFNIEDPFKDTHAMMWIRGFWVDERKLGDRIIAHGHTPIPWPVIRRQAGENVIDIDGGCVYTKHHGFGYLVALNLSSGEFIAVENCE